ncbi:hypothetical protein ACLMJK_006178 [Lecanora helva]
MSRVDPQKARAGTRAIASDPIPGALFAQYSEDGAFTPFAFTTDPSITLQAIVSSIPLQATRPSCAENPNFPEWYQPSKKFDNGDCQKAIEIFNNDYVQTHEGTRYEFYTSKVSPIHGIPAQRVPLKFAHGTCTVAIAMRNQFNWGELPHETPFRSAPSDVSSFQKIYQGVLEINNECVEMDGQPGWYESGDLNSIAVFIWQAGSDINQRIQPSLGGQGAYNTTQLLLDTA